MAKPERLPGGFEPANGRAADRVSEKEAEAGRSRSRGWTASAAASPWHDPGLRLQRLHKEAFLGAAVSLLVSIVWEERSNESHAEKGLEDTLWRTQCDCDEYTTFSSRHFLQLSVFIVFIKRTMKDRSSTPPLHVHVDENTPVHVHIKKLPKPSATNSQKSHKRGMKGDTVNVRRSVRVKTKNPPHCLEITPPSSEKLVSVMRLSDLSTEDDDSGHCKMNRYDKKIDSLMNAVGCLKSEVKMQKGERQMAKRFLEERKEELEEVAQELAETEHENTVLRHNIERIKEEKDFTMLQKKHLQQEKECLMSKLVEAEMDGAAAAKQVMALKDTIGKLKTEKQMTCSDINTLTRQKELLLQKLSTFEETNRTLRDLLREQHCKEDSEKLMEQQGALLKRLAEADSEKAVTAQSACYYCCKTRTRRWKSSSRKYNVRRYHP
ncbi:Outer dense fiber protein 2 [Camelus dromedarius]|uniref:Outer dense fiber protein 2 n=1 Tax=Camelus dromedarius TaxID=9838 RepID=A0A5N4EB86_CAMDR|nr:Outer dense fiber protein 2 [Camelus dromedarius]